MRLGVAYDCQINGCISEGGIALEAGRSWVRFPMGVTGVFEYLILPPVALWLWVILVTGQLNAPVLVL